MGSKGVLPSMAEAAWQVRAAETIIQNCFSIFVSSPPPPPIRAGIDLPFKHDE